MIDRIDSQLNFSRTALNLRAYRQELLASNIANADTPNYKARDVDFASALKNALSGKVDGALPMAMTTNAHINSGDSNPFNTAIKYRNEYQSAVDGNSVNMDIERAAFAENSMQVEALLTFIRTNFTDLRAAMQSQ